MMLMIQGGVNENYLSLSERLSVPSGYTILTRFISEDTLVDTTTLPVTVSGTHAYRYHKLTITEKVAATDAERIAGNVTLDPYGMMLYEVYQTSGSTVSTCCFDMTGFPVDPSGSAVSMIINGEPSEVLGLEGWETVEDIFDYITEFINTSPDEFYLSGNSICVDNPENDYGEFTLKDSLGVVEFTAVNACEIPVLDYLQADKLLEVGKCLVTKSGGFDVITEYTGT